MLLAVLGLLSWKYPISDLSIGSTVSTEINSISSIVTEIAPSRKKVLRYFWFSIEDSIIITGQIRLYYSNNNVKPIGEFNKL